MRLAEVIWRRCLGGQGSPPGPPINKLPAVGVAGAELSGIFNAFAGYGRPSEAGNI